MKNKVPDPMSPKHIFKNSTKGPVRCVVVGGGAAGLMAAGQAALAGAEVVLLEKMSRLGRKLAITGKGRCNLTNIASLPTFIEHFGATGPFLRQAFHRFFTADLLDFFQELGVPTVTERGGRVFPASGKAPEVVAALRHWIDHCGVEVRTGITVDRLLIESGAVIGVACGGNIIPCTALILATGGASYPLTGSTGDGYRLAEQVGHRLVPIRPALVPLVTEAHWPEEAVGLQLCNIRVELVLNGKKRSEAFGELTIMEFGLSGPVILTLSSQVVDALNQGLAVHLRLDLKPALDNTKLDARLVRDFEKRRQEPLISVLRALLPRGLVSLALAATGLAADRMVGTIRSEERKRLRHWLKNWSLRIIAHRPLAEAIITAGGVDIREVNPRTMASSRIQGLFFAGEILDIQADTGGYNLQAAFSTGWLAGQAAAQPIDNPLE